MGKLTFVLHDESVNTYGFRMLTSGANLEEFKKNPVMLLNHDDYSLPIGRWENIRVEGDLMLPGQTLPTVTRWTVREGSVVTIGANHNALVFYDRESKQIIDLNDKGNLIRLIDHSNNPKKQLKMSVLTGVLKLQDSASEAEIVTAIQGIIANADRLEKENKTLAAAVDKMNEAKKESQKREAVSLTDAAIKDGRYDAKGRDNLLNLFDKDFEGTKAMLAAIPCRANVAGQINTDKGSGVTLGDWKDKSWDELDKAGKLVELKDAAPDLYKSKFKERFGIEPNL